MSDLGLNRRHLAGALLAGSAGLALAAGPAAAQKAGEGELSSRLKLMEDRAALKHLVDTFSNLADVKDIDTQVKLFTEDATVESRTAGQPGSSFKGREELAAAFGGFLAQFHTVYHINGQQTVEIDGDTATGTAYCLVVLIRDENGTQVQRTSGVRYDDRYVRQDGTWLIAGRTSHFEWTEISETPT